MLMTKQKLNSRSKLHRAEGVVINELLPDPEEADAGKEWVELYNGSSGEVDLSGWIFAAGTSSFSRTVALPGDTLLPSGAYLVVGASALEGVQVVLEDLPTMGNAGSNADAVQLRDCVDAAVDTVVYGTDNTDGWVDDGGSGATSFAPRPVAGASLARDPDGVDTDASGDDFVVLDVPTPGVANDAPPPDCGGPGSGIVINELMPNPEGADTDAEWIELFHAGAEELDVTGWALQAATSSYSTVTELEGTMAPGDRRVIGGSAVPEADVIDSFSLGNAGSNADAVRLLDCGGVAADTVVYGAPNDGEAPFLDDLGEVASSLAPAPGEGAALQRVEDGYDTDQSGVDFVVTTSPSPGAENPVVEPVICTPSNGDVVLNEILPDPAGEDAGGEFVELYNRGGAPVSVAGWAISAGTRDFSSRDVVFGGGASVPAGGFLVVAGADVEEADVVLPFSLGNGTGTDGVRLVDCADATVDTVLYGEPGNEDQVPDDLGGPAEPYGDPGSDESLARVADGVDTDAAEDWTVRARPTPGATNVVQVPDPGDPGDGPRGGCGGGGPPSGTEDPASGCSTGAGWPMAGLVLLAGLVARRRR